MEVVVVYFNVLSRHSPGGVKKHYVNPHSGLSMSWLRLEQDTSRTELRIVTS